MHPIDPLLPRSRVQTLKRLLADREPDPRGRLLAWLLKLRPLRTVRVLLGGQRV